MKIKKTRAEKREEKQKKLKEKQASFSDQVKKMKASGDYQGDVKKFTKWKGAQKNIEPLTDETV